VAGPCLVASASVGGSGSANVLRCRRLTAQNRKPGRDDRDFVEIPMRGIASELANAGWHRTIRGSRRPGSRPRRSRRALVAQAHGRGIGYRRRLRRSYSKLDADVSGPAASGVRRPIRATSRKASSDRPLGLADSLQHLRTHPTIITCAPVLIQLFPGSNRPASCDCDSALPLSRRILNLLAA
jgi:hypothetical protein